MKKNSKGLYDCPICGKMFACYSPSNWSYKITSKTNERLLYCSYTCHRKAEKEMEEDKTDDKT